MDLGAAGLQAQPFPSHGKPLARVSYAAERAAAKMLGDTRDAARGISLLQGPPLSGKSTLIRTYVGSVGGAYAVAVVDGQDIDTGGLLTTMLQQFGYSLKTSSANEVMGLVRVFVMQQAASGKVPMLIVENAHGLSPDTFRALCDLAELRVQAGSALKIVLASDRSLQAIISSHAMEPIKKRLLHDIHMRPMTEDESKTYLYAKLRAAGSECPEYIFPSNVCQTLFVASGGWPGVLDRIALLALARATSLPVSIDNIEHPALPAPTWDADELAIAEQSNLIPPKPPQLVVTNNGSVICELTMEKSRLLIGRSDHNDISIGSRFVSRHHALLVRHDAATFLMDLNSTNGTFVNSVRVSNHVLVHDDIIIMGHHRIKFYDPYATTRGQLDSVDFADTAIMKSLQDMRQLLAQENTALLPRTSENSPTIGT
jgi:type II secretory pathway predicted ATPase ExeA